MILLLDRLPSALFDAIVAQLSPRERRMLASSSRRLADAVRRRLPTFRVRPSLWDCAQTLGLFLEVDSALPEDALVRNVARMAQDPYRRAALRNWINAQRVAIDAGGFFTPNRGYHASGMARIRINLWDRPLGIRRVHPHRASQCGVEEVVFLRQAFAQNGYDP